MATNLALVGITVNCPQSGSFVCRGGDHKVLVAQELSICHSLGVPTQLAQLTPLRPALPFNNVMD